MKITRSLLTATALTLFAQTAGAQVAPRLGDQQGLKFWPNRNAPWEAVPSIWNGVLVGPYKASLMAPGVTSPQVTIYCVDYAHGVGWGQEWTADVSYLTSGDLSDSRLGDVGLGQYQQAAYLSSLFDSWESYVAVGVTKAQAWSGLHALIWNTTTPGFGIPGAVDVTPWQTALNTAIASNYAGFDFSEWAVLTDVTDPGVQEYLIRTSSVPEPGTVFLLGSGILGLAVATRRRRRSA